MKNALHVPTKELPETIKAALSAVGYAKRDIGVEARERVSPAAGGGQGRREFLVLLDIATGRTERHDGSWGGANAFNPSNPIDLDTNSYPLPDGCAVIQGSIGYGGTWATLVLNPANVAKLLPAPAAALTDVQRGVLYAYGAIKPGAYRREELARCGATDSDVEGLVALGLLKRDGRGVSITTAGKNARNS